MLHCVNKYQWLDTLVTARWHFTLKSYLQEVKKPLYHYIAQGCTVAEVGLDFSILQWSVTFMH